jgi:predicted dehydrogenase
MARDGKRRTRGNGNGKRRAGGDRREKIRWAVIGQGHFAQTSVLPAFAHARENSQLVALFSGDDKKRKQLGRRHDVEFALPYEELDDFLRSGQVQAAYIAVPNHLHKEMTIRAAQAGVHVVCEKPMAPTAAECREMMEACEETAVKLMIAYRLHLEPANLGAIEEIRRGRIGDPRYFTSAFSFQLDDDNVRGLPTGKGGGPLYDIGTYCINAARYLFQDEPFEATGLAATRPDDPRFTDTDEQVSAILRFPDDRLATFTVAFGSADASTYSVLGTKGSIRLDPAYSHAGKREMFLETPRGKRRSSFAPRDQVAPELVYFADCILRDREPEPSGWEGYHDVVIIEAILESIRTGRRIPIDLEPRRQRPTKAQLIQKPPAEEPEPVHAEAPRS